MQTTRFETARFGSSQKKRLSQHWPQDLPLGEGRPVKHSLANVSQTFSEESGSLRQGRRPKGKHLLVFLYSLSVWDADSLPNQEDCCMHWGPRTGLVAPLNQLNAMLSLLVAIDCYRAPSAIGSAIGRPYLALFRISMQARVLNRLILNRLRSSTARSWC